MSPQNFYCMNIWACRCTRKHMLVIMWGRRYWYCLHCRRRKEEVSRTRA